MRLTKKKKQLTPLINLLARHEYSRGCRLFLQRVVFRQTNTEADFIICLKQASYC